jgi:uncharacterized protein (TIGR02246 family)
MRQRCLFGLALSLAATLAFGLISAISKMPARAAESKAEEKVQLGKGKRAKEFIAAYNRGDARALAAFWTEDADYVDETGQKFRGRAAIQKMYDNFFDQNKGMKLNIIITSSRMLGPDVALEDGITEVTPAGSRLPSDSRFSAVLVRRYGEWFLASVRDSIAQPPSNADHFEDLEWLLGEWTSDGEKGEGSKASYDWAENRNFIVSNFATTLDGVPVIGGTQWIAWDAVDKKIRSISFYSGGGIGQAVWTKNGDTWAARVNAKTAAGKKVSATNLLTKVDADHATWQITKLTVDGQLVPDPKPVKMKRVKAETP